MNYQQDTSKHPASQQQPLQEAQTGPHHAVTQILTELWKKRQPDLSN